jgi:hypothetical protein
VEIKVATVFRRFEHHSASSGYPRFAERLPEFIRARHPAACRLPGVALRRASGAIEYEWFGPDQLRNDLTAARRLVTGRDEIVHLLYGETDHFYAGRLRRFGRRRGNRLVATFHQPPAIIEELLLLADERARDRLSRSARARAEAVSLEAAARRHAEIYRAVGA